MNDCTDRDIKELLPDLLHRTLLNEDRKRVELHMATCESCREDLGVLRVVKSAAVFAPAIDVGRIVRQIPPYQRITPVVEAPARSRVPRWLTAAAAAVLVIGGGSLLLSRQPAETTRTVAVDTTSSGAPLETTVAQVQPPTTGTTVAAKSSPAHAFALASDVASLSDGDLVQLMNEMDDFDALPVAEPEPVIDVDSGDSL
jgi:anti-sigma factor RsiW